MQTITTIGLDIAKSIFQVCGVAMRMWQSSPLSSVEAPLAHWGARVRRHRPPIRGEAAKPTPWAAVNREVFLITRYVSVDRLFAPIDRITAPGPTRPSL